MKVLVTGASGLLGSTLVPAFREAGVEVIAHGNGRAADRNADLTDRAAARDLVDATRPDALLNLAAWSNVDRCQRDLPGAHAVNADAVGNLARALEEVLGPGEGARLVHVGTDQVYSAPGPSPEDAITPVNVYGLSKYAGDLLALGARGTVVRTNFFGPSLHPARVSQSDFFLGAFREGREVTLWTDVTFNPLTMATLSEVLLDLVERRPGGVWNAGSRDPMTKRDFARALAEDSGLPLDHARDGRAADMDLAAPRPPDTSMAVAALEGLLGRSLPSFRDEIASLA